MKPKKALLVFLGCSSFVSFIVAKEVIAPEELGIRKAPLEKEVVTPPKLKYPKTPPGQSKRFKRAYENAPPQIPHSIEGMFPITLKNNTCLSCHMPDIAKQIGATPLPPTHFIDFYYLPKGKAPKLTDIDKARWNCLLCHRPQANVKPVVKNLFKPEFRVPQAKEKSSLHEAIYEGVGVRK
ncbi:MAG TPA: nitrate reductase cytochrome c-type subunit; periplasmic nitrate reductase electron transfer subunit [Aquifex aeolicus]|nr:nitrate reductase cytochrome c-type subunit; periplasmic nitrate reductase electron transfer subunit [Pyrodictium sp.]HIP43469.1 nitrate reductase cytochrome c-type subunit; periplasmic nitrate reductase electron transfer subunit [Aquifex aeolicus]